MFVGGEIDKCVGKWDTYTLNMCVLNYPYRDHLNRKRNTSVQPRLDLHHFSHRSLLVSGCFQVNFT